MSKPPRHPVDQLSIRYGKRLLICSVIYSAIVAVAGWAEYSGITWVAEADLQSVVGLFGTTVLLLCGLGYIVMGRSRRLRMRFPSLILIHFWGANLALCLGIVLRSAYALLHTTPPVATRALPIALNIAAGGIFVFNVWRSLQRVPAPTTAEPLRERRLQDQ